MKARLIFFFLIIFGACGYFREFLFVHINKLMYMKYRNADVYAADHMEMPTVIKPLNLLSYSALYYSKYIFTLLWVFIFYMISYFAIKKLTANKNLIKILAWSYLLLLILAGISMAYGYIIKERLQDDEYTLSRWLMGIAQSPLICLILLASDKLNKTSLSK